LIVGTLTLVAKAGATVKELIVAQSFGRSDALDAFLIAYLLPSFVTNLVMGALAFALLPTFVEVRQREGAGAAQKLFSSTMFLCLLLLAALAVLLGFLAPYYLPYLGSSFPAAKLLLTRRLLYALLPFVFFSGIATCATAVLNSGETFALPAIVPLATPLITILLIELSVNRWGPFSLAGGVVAGSIVEAAVLAHVLRKHGVRLNFRWHGFDAGVRNVLGQYAPMLAGAFLMGGTSIVDQSMAAMLPAGSVAALGYGYRVVSLTLALGAGSLSTAVFPYFSKMVAQNDWNGCRHTLKRYSALVLLATAPFTLCLMAFSRPLIRLLFQRGAFSGGDTDLVSWVQTGYAIQIPFYVCGMLFIRFLSSIRRNDVLLYAAAMNLVLDIVLNLVLMRVWGVAGIAVSTSLVSIASLLFVAGFSIMLLTRQRIAVPVTAGVQK